MENKICKECDLFSYPNEAGAECIVDTCVNDAQKSLGGPKSMAFAYQDGKISVLGVGNCKRFEVDKVIIGMQDFKFSVVPEVRVPDELHLVRSSDKDGEDWEAILEPFHPRIKKVRHKKGSDCKHIFNRRDGFVLVPLKNVPVRVAKYDVRLRDASVRAVQGMHALLTNMVRFTCNDCKERFPAFHPAFMPPPELAKNLEVLKPLRDGLAACSIEVARWDSIPPWKDDRAESGLAYGGSG